MKKNYSTAFKTFLLTLLFFSFFSGYSQNKDEIASIVKEYDLKKLAALQEKYHLQAKAEKVAALKAAKENNWPEFRANKNGSVDELMKLTPDGQPLYYSVDNVNAAKSTRANFLNSGGGLGLALDGQGMTARVWDGGKVRASHQEFGNRVTVNDDVPSTSGNNFHATHVTGTITASGVNASAKGMAPLAQVRTFNWTDDLSEAAFEAQNGMLVSNHSYGVPIINNSGVAIASWYIGAYSAESRSWDELLYNAPYYLMVASAGNNGTDTNQSPSTTGFDKLTGNKVSKNNLVIANAQDANIAANGNLTSVFINSGSSQGPADDLRIKPDITGNGTGLFSTLETSDTAYGSLSGTSMSAPNVTGTLLLLQQHYKNTNTKFMKAATLKALACHTADDAGRPGPDVVFGWGLLNAKKAAETITANGLTTVISEETLRQGESFTMTVNASGTEPLDATIVWTDAPGNANSGILNSTTPALVNDLDIRVRKSFISYFPWKMTSNAGANAIKTGDNNVDNVEKVNIPGATGTYTITVNHKGTLQSGAQNFSIIVTGVTSTFAIMPIMDDKTICSTEAAAYTFRYITTNTDITTFTATNLPNGALATFSSPSLTSNGEVVMTISNLQNALPGDYIIGITATNATGTKTKNVKMKLYDANFQNLTLTSPTNAQDRVPTNVELAWVPDVNTVSYRVQVASDEAFSNLVINQLTSESKYVVTGLSEATKYYWRILPSNSCGEATNASQFNFTTGVLSCDNVFTATNFLNATISTQENALAKVPVTVTGNITIGNLTASVNISHTYMQEMTVYLEGPAEIGSPRVYLFKEPCGDNENIAATLSDSGEAYVCANAVPSITGTVKPFETLTRYNNLPAQGIWTLYAIDNEAGDGGRINGFSLNFCNVTSSLLNVQANELANVIVYPNPTQGILTIQLPENRPEKTMLRLFDIQGRNILSKESSNAKETLNIENLSDGIYMLSIQNGHLKTTKKIILNR